MCAKINKGTFNLMAHKYRPEIDGLRAFAVVTVIINHFNKSILPGGYLGVDIFFVISGYVITSSLFGRQSRNFKDFIGGFYERRLKRLLPALMIFVLVMSVAISFFNASPERSLKTGIASLFGLSNIYLFRLSTDYFAQSTELNVFTNTWSLGVEEQFYLLFPFIIWFSGFSRQTKNGIRNLFFIVLVLSISSLIGFLYLYPKDQSAAYFLMPPRFWEMAVGCLVFILLQTRPIINKLTHKLSPLLVLISIVLFMLLPMAYAEVATIAIVAQTSLLIICLRNNTLGFRLLTHPRVVYIGLTSYSLYLWHWGILSLSRWTIGVYWWSVPFQLALILILAILSYEWIETPIRRGKLTGHRHLNLIAGVGVLAFSGLSLFFFSKLYAKALFLSPSFSRLSWGSIPGSGIIQEDCYTTGHENDFSIKSQNCIVDYSRDLEASTTISPQFILLGDSHARHHVYLLNFLARNFSTSGLFLRCDNVSIPSVIQGFSPRDIDNFECGQRLVDHVVKYSKDRKIILILSSRWSSRFFKDFKRVNDKPIEARILKNYPNNFSSFEADTSFLKDLHSLAKQLSTNQSSIIVLDSLPEFQHFRSQPVQEHGSLCQESWFNQNIQNIPPCVEPEPSLRERLYLRNRMSDFSESLSNLSQLNKNLHIFDQFDIICPSYNTYCSTHASPDTPLYLDNDHLNEYSSLLIAQKLALQIKTWSLF